jgi:hypothetical protein
MIRTSIPVTQWEKEGEEVIMTAFRLLNRADQDSPEQTDEELRAAWGVD